MNAVLEKPSAKARGRKAVPAAPASTPTPLASAAATLFAEVGDFLALASGTDEDHAFSGESDRLLSIGAMIALDAAKGKYSNTNAENTVYDIAACINSARLVPDDDESVERTLHIENAAQRLAGITGMQVHQMIFTDVPRPTRTPAPAPSTEPVHSRMHFTQEQLKELYQQAYVHIECANEVLIHYAKNADDGAIFALRDLLDVYLEQAKDRLSNEEVGSLSSGDLPDLSCDLARILALLGPHATLNDDGVLHGVDHLLSSAKRIVDGDLGVLG